MDSIGDFPITLEYLKYGDNQSFDHFFRNSFMHFYLRAKEFGSLGRELKQKLAVAKCEQIISTSSFLVGFDKEDKNVFYCFCAYTQKDNKLFVHFAYVKKSVRGFGFFKESLRILKYLSNEYYYTLPIKIKKGCLPEFTRKVL
jgi:hypothetical protein